jgi:hypothetical protein
MKKGMGPIGSVSDWQHPHDYNPQNAEWHDATKLGSAYQEQIDNNKANHWRHRNVAERGPWKKGEACPAKQ